VSEPLDMILANAAVGTDLTCTISPETVQVLLFGLGFLADRSAWLQDENDAVSDVEWTDIQNLLSLATYEMLP